jgi:hypothetical protein
MQVQPILQYGAELWGLDDAAQCCEKVHLFALKKFLCVSRRTPNDFVYKELDRYPITINFVVRCMKYWMKLLRMTNERIPKKAYNMLLNLDERGKVNWVTKVRECLFVFGFGVVWLNQEVGDENLFMRVFKQRLIDCKWQNIVGHINDSDRFSLYSTFSGIRGSVPVYLELDFLDRHLKFILTKFRFGISELNTHFYRYRNCTDVNLKCPLCMYFEENEIHFVLTCPGLATLRKQLIPLKYYRVPNAFHFSLLMASRNRNTVKNLSIYLYRAFKIRQILIGT